MATDARKTRGARECGFSLVEVALSVGIVSFALLSIVALLPVGMKVNQQSSNEVQASDLLSALEADLRNTYPSANSGKSRVFGLALPYSVDAAGVESLDTGLNLNQMSSVGIADSGGIVPITTTPKPAFQATVTYVALPATNSSGPTQARLIINWPCINAASVAQLTSASEVKGYVEAYVTFPAP